MEHDIKLIDETPVYSKSYPIPHKLRDKIFKEIDILKKIDMIEINNSPYNSPIFTI